MHLSGAHTLPLATAVLAASLAGLLLWGCPAGAHQHDEAAPLALRAPLALVATCVFGVLIWLGRTLYVAG
jgi:hypothetical protein